jgi:hypothetical protein
MTLIDLLMHIRGFENDLLMQGEWYSHDLSMHIGDDLSLTF